MLIYRKNPPHLELVSEGDEGGEVVVAAGRGEGTGDTADHHLLAREQFRGGHVLDEGER